MEENNEYLVKVDQKVGLLNWNFAELNAQLDAGLKKYDGLVFDDSEISLAKKTRADLNRFKTSIDNQRKNIKKQFCAPYDEFAEQAKELCTKIDSVSSKIDIQIKDYEEQTKQNKKKLIEDYWETHRPQGMKIELSSIWNERWLNSSFSETAWKSEINSISGKIDNDLTQISLMKPTDKLNFMAVDYQKTIDLGTSLANYEAYRQAKERAQSVISQAEIKPYKNDLEKNDNLPENNESVSTNGHREPAEQYSEYYAVMEVSGDLEQMTKLNKMLQESGVQFIVKDKGTRPVRKEEN
jgi:hypothetical protein